MGRLCELELPPPLSRAVVGVYSRAYDVNLQEAEPLNGRGAYESFDAFFTRRLRQDAREHDAAEQAVVSPADGRLDACGRVEREGVLEVKGRPYRARDLLGNDEEAARYLGGQFALVYLSPRDYHRVHTPVAGRLRETRSYPGELFPVNSVSERHIPDFLARNRRVAMVIDSPQHGRVTVVMVAAMIVGRITVTGIDARDVPFGTHPLDIELERGDELGIFHLGSTAVLFLEPGVAPFDRGLGPIQVGETLIDASIATGDGDG